MHTEQNTKTDTDPGLIADRIVTAAALLDSVALMADAYTSEVDVGQIQDHRVLVELHRRGWKIERKENGSEWYEARLRAGARAPNAWHRVAYHTDYATAEQVAEVAAIAEAA